MSGSKVKKSAGSINSLACFNEWDTAGAKRLKYPAREARQTSSGRLRACPGVVYFTSVLGWYVSSIPIACSIFLFGKP